MSAIPQYYKRRALLTALYRDTALLRLPYIGIPPYSDCLISGYHLAQTALYRYTALLRPPYIGISPCSDRLVSGYRLAQAAWTPTALQQNIILHLQSVSTVALHIPPLQELCQNRQKEPMPHTQHAWGPLFLLIVPRCYTAAICDTLLYPYKKPKNIYLGSKDRMKN